MEKHAALPQRGCLWQTIQQRESVACRIGGGRRHDGKTDRWESYAALPTPRHGAGAVAIGNAIYCAGGAPLAGTTFLTSANEAFTLG